MQTINYILSDSSHIYKQSDVILLSWPLNWNMSTDIIRNDLDYYELYLDPRTPAMTYSFRTVAWKWVNEEAKMINDFLKSYQDYTISPFRVRPIANV